MDLSMFALTDKVAIVTGGGRGIGRAIALGFAQAGADVVVAARTDAEIEETAAMIRDTGRKALAVPTDVREVEQVASMLDKTMDLFGRVDILVNNAGGATGLTSVLDMGFDIWEANIKVNLTSVFICSKIIGEAMVKQKRGNIVSIASVAGMGPWPNVAHYGAAKAGIISLTKTLAVEWAQYNIRVNAIAPGSIQTPLASRLASLDSPRRQAQLKSTPLGRFGQPEDIAEVAIFLASDASAFITGETIVVNGGQTTTVFPM